ncbi:DUF6893 family small protein [Streptomyces clavuligerus]|uniref:Uncharacterized protein n=1 Tax=Streptomyces clavuligerus TaxID=1901 RepID=B5H085_STRCL|nr:hypothetical protein SSCG_05046 [Streptomyces clavuligerus]EFG05416.1 Hypothetical protein SCLAV_0340 [Streptomyces clavuligerus]
MLKAVVGTALAGAIGLVLWRTMPDIRRYLEISRM